MSGRHRGHTIFRRRKIPQVCLSCGCHRPGDDHGDPRHVTSAGLDAAADAAEITPVAAAANIADGVSMAGSSFADRMARPVVVCDIDGVLARFADAACTAVNARFGSSWRYGDWTSYKGPFDPKQHRFMEDELFVSDGFWASIAPDTEAIAALRRLASEHVVVVVSNRPKTAKKVTAVWLDVNRVPYTDVEVLGSDPKGPVAQRWGERSGAVLVDDNPARWLDCANLPGVCLVCPRRPWTPDAAGYSGVTAVDGWDEIATLASGYSRVYT